MKKTVLVLVAVLGVLAVAGVAAAGERPGIIQPMDRGGGVVFSSTRTAR